MLESSRRASQLSNAVSTVPVSILDQKLYAYSPQQKKYLWKIYFKKVKYIAKIV